MFRHPGNHAPAKAEQKARALELLDELGIKHLMDQRASVLSGGERRRLEISRALATNPAFILLDEPFAGIDPLAVADIKKDHRPSQRSKNWHPDLGSQVRKLWRPAIWHSFWPMVKSLSRVLPKNCKQRNRTQNLFRGLNSGCNMAIELRQQLNLPSS